MRHPSSPTLATNRRKDRTSGAPVMSLVKRKILNGKRIVLTGIVQMAHAGGYTYSIHGLAKKLNIPMSRVRAAVFRGEIDAEGSKSGTRTRWRITKKMAHRMAKIAGADHDRLWTNGTYTTRLLTAMKAQADLSKYHMRPTHLPWLDRLLTGSRATIVVGLRLRTLSGMTISDNKEHAENPFVVSVSDLAAACNLSEASVKVALRELRDAGLITSVGHQAFVWVG